MKGLNKTLMTISLIFEVICLIASIWVSAILKDGVSYMMVVIFAAAVVFTSVTLLKSNK
ncbi:MAG: hypothetical protein MJY59_00780 [Bacteroidaceae bacterium]|nr:hypothetical protein [Bacteroidaceae bacterium]